MHTRDLDEAIEAVANVFCPHTVQVSGRSPRLDMRLEVRRAAFQPLAELSYGAPVTIDSNVARFLALHCVCGAAAVAQGGREAEWRRGQTMLLSAGLETQLRLGAHCVLNALLLDTERLEAQCMRWLGRPLERPLRFALRPFSAELEQAWQGALAYLRTEAGDGLLLSPAARAAFDEFLLTLLLHQHPHNYSGEMARPAAAPVPGLVRRAERFMADNADAPITVSDVADHLGVSLRSLQAGFRSWRNATPSAFLRRVRLERVREELLRADGAGSVTTVALRHGFSHLGRFSAHYRSAFGEAPSVTLRRGRASRPRHSLPAPAPPR